MASRQCSGLYRLTVKRSMVRETAAFPIGNLICSPDSVATIAMKLLSGEEQECLLAFFVNSQNRVVAYSEIGRGGLDRCELDVRVLFRAALLTPTCTALVVAHNHPSGSKQPSEADNRLTRRVRQAGRLIGIGLIDHVIVAGDELFSFAREGTL